MKKVKEIYIKRGFGQKMGFGERPAVIVVDMMNAFSNTNSPLGMVMNREIEIINRVIQAARSKDVPIYFSLTCYKNISEAGIWFLKQSGLNTLMEGTSAVEIDSRINKEDWDKTVKKHYASAFFGTDLASQLNFKQVDTLIIIGCSTSGCVKATAVDAISYGYRPIVVVDAVVDRDKNAHRQSLINLETRYADVINSAGVIKYLKSLTKQTE